LDDIPVTWASTPALELGITLADRMMQKITNSTESHAVGVLPAVRQNLHVTRGIIVVLRHYARHW
ncbi:hypothetical protein IBK40_24000, partial [Escherichia coli]|nr:hypothetical protein [Escherichia coli]